MLTKKDTGGKDIPYNKKVTTLQKKIEKYKKEIEQLKRELQEKNDKLLRSYADIQNYQRRSEKEILSREDELKKKYLSEFIDLKELLQKAYTDKNPKDGLKVILNNMESFFKKEQVTYIDCVGKLFDHNHHHAISTVERDDCKDGEIVKEIKKGYMVGDKILRPSQVIVAKNKRG